MMQPMTDDPAGFYARLEVAPTAPRDAVAFAFRRMARVLHPDVVGTGDAEAFMRVMEAYHVLGDAERRAAYDRAAQAAVAAESAAPVVAEPVTRGPRFSDLPVALWTGLGGLACLASVMALVQFNRPQPPPTPTVARPFAPSARTAAPTPAPTPLPVATAPSGMTTHYVVAAGGTAVLWRHDATRDAYLPAGELADFSSVQALGLVPQHGLVEIRLADGGSGFVDAMRLAPGDGATAHRAYCAYNAGTSPENGEVLDRRGAGPARLQIANRGGEPAVVKLRDASGTIAASVFLAPGGSTNLTGLPDNAYRPEYALGELWSRACHDFAAGMRAQQFGGYASLTTLSPLVIPPDLSVDPPPVDIPDTAFERE
jgi:hypothetical protein